MLTLMRIEAPGEWLSQLCCLYAVWWYCSGLSENSSNRLSPSSQIKEMFNVQGSPVSTQPSSKPFSTSSAHIYTYIYICICIYISAPAIDKTLAQTHANQTTANNKQRSKKIVAVMNKKRNNGDMHYILYMGIWVLGGRGSHFILKNLRFNLRIWDWKIMKIFNSLKRKSNSAPKTQTHMHTFDLQKTTGEIPVLEIPFSLCYQNEYFFSNVPSIYDVIFHRNK